MWTSGNINGFGYSVKHFDEASGFGIDDGCISKLTITKDGRTLCNYERSWDVEVQPEAQAVYEQLLQMFDIEGASAEEKDATARALGTGKAPEASLSEQIAEFKAWEVRIASGIKHWIEDKVLSHNQKCAFFYRGGEDGVYIKIGKDGSFDAGTYEGAYPHIGEAMFRRLIHEQFDSYDAAYQRVVKLGLLNIGVVTLDASVR
jgi:hypothetical protein